MKYIFLFTALLLATSFLKAQEVAPDTGGTRSMLYNAFGYSNGLGTESYGEFSWVKPISDRLQVQMGMSNDRGQAIQVISAGVRANYYLTKKTYLFTGAQNTYEANMMTNGRFVRSTSAMIGVGHQYNRTTQFELGYGYEIGRSTGINPILTIQQPQTLKFRARF